jgi:hypothetical protein
MNNTKSFSFSSLDDGDDDNDETVARCRMATFDFFFIGDVSESDVIKCFDLVRSLVDDFFFVLSVSDDENFE